MGDRLTDGEADRSLCVICGLHPQAPEYKPFCSRRCADVDLHRWLGGVYAIPATPDDEDDESEASG
ncbi:DNA gyrase inhibitor YacG [Rhodomicrobium sp.]|uniref:DNA gyrase inhibitor YacG n=1 Tax=Rhodomicrobium sp. TaxID=2720632 RepID=UPI0039E641AA